jgi:hypothetical protein
VTDEHMQRIIQTPADLVGGDRGRSGKLIR